MAPFFTIGLSRTVKGSKNNKLNRLDRRWMEEWPWEGGGDQYVIARMEMVSMEVYGVWKGRFDNLANTRMQGWISIVLTGEWKDEYLSWSNMEE
jgi:hypothetical protein